MIRVQLLGKIPLALHLAAVSRPIKIQKQLFIPASRIHSRL